MNFLDDLDTLLEQAVNDTFGRQERLRQAVQSKKIDKDSLRVTTDKQKDSEDVDEAEDDVEDDKKPASKQSKLTGDPEKVTKQLAQRAADKEREDSVPGTPTSKNLRDLSSDERGMLRGRRHR